MIKELNDKMLIVTNNIEDQDYDEQYADKLWIRINKIEDRIQIMVQR